VAAGTPGRKITYNSATNELSFPEEAALKIRSARLISVFFLILALTAMTWGQVPSAAMPAGFSAETASAVRVFVEATMKQWNVAGAAVGIVKDGRIVFLEGFGKRDTALNLPVTPKTRFILGSTTKAFTALAVGLLVADKKLEWDKPVASFLPEFRLQDEYASAHATPRDLAAHRTGLPRHDFVWVNAPMDLPEMVRSLRFLEPSRELRASFQYNNLMYISLGYLVEKVSGSPWDEFVRERIFRPLGMKNSGLTIPEFTAAPEYAFSYRWEKDAFAAQRLPLPADKLMYGARASGSVNTTAEDMCAWLTVHLEAYRAGAKPALPANILRETHSPQIPLPWSPQTNSEVLTPAYGLGWMIDVYRDHWRVHHGGSTLDFNSYVALYPRAQTGVVVLINASSPANDILALGLSDLALGLVPIDWNKRVADQIKARRAAAPPEKRVEGTQPAHKLEDYAGEYAHPAYGLMTVEVKNGGLAVNYKGFASPLEHWHYETFRPKESELEGQKLTFRTDSSGGVTALSAPLESAVKEIVFERRTTKKP
jgi:CubicO group peptidase (beta-lactamase class C family)